MQNKIPGADAGSKKRGEKSFFYWLLLAVFLQPHAPKYAFRHEIVRSNRKTI
jgi:hypothetical protein